MVFYAQSTSTVISGRVETGVRIYTEKRERERGREGPTDRDTERERETET